MTRDDDLLARAKQPAADALRLHPHYRGKIQTAPKAPIRSLADFAIWYTPGVAAPCRAVQEHPHLVYEHTNKANTVAVSDGTRVLGLGDIGAEAGLNPTRTGDAGASPRRWLAADVCLAFSASLPGTIRPEWIRAMAPRAIVFACANPLPAKTMTRVLTEANLARRMPGEDS
jgi:malic enzyme